MLFVECSLSDAAIACASWCGSWYVGFVAIFLLICRSFYWRVYDFSDVFSVYPNLLFDVGKMFDRSKDRPALIMLRVVEIP